VYAALVAFVCVVQWRGGNRVHKVARSIAVAILALLYGCGAVSATTVSGANGAVLVNDGKGFVPLSGSADVAPGSRVMVSPGQVATITYSEGCSVKVGSGRVWVIQQGNPCPNGAREVDLTGRMNDGMGSLKDSPAPAESHDGLLIGGAAVVGGSLLIVCVVDWCNQTSKGASP
jgi:hypothetical protein